MLTIVVFGASGDLACKKTFPSLWKLFLHGKLPETTNIVGYARSNLSVENLVEKFIGYAKETENEKVKFGEFVKTLSYVSGHYDDEAHVKRLARHLEAIENCKDAHRLFYLTLPPSVYKVISKNIKLHLCVESSKGWKQIIVEKPFGRDLESFQDLSKHMSSYFDESQIYRIDHYLGKEMIQNILVMRFANRYFEPLFNKDHVKIVQITFKEDFGTYGRGGYYDTSGVIRDFVQNHIMQVLTLIAMEPPKSLNSDDIINEKVKVLKSIKQFSLEETVLGQYVGNPDAAKGSPESFGYKDDKTVPCDSNTPTFISMVCYIDNDRWRGVPFILKAGKALNERKGDIRIQFKEPDDHIFSNFATNFVPNNELVIKLQPEELIYVKMQTKIPGLEFKMKTCELDLTMKERLGEGQQYEAYEKLILDVISQTHINFVRDDELEASWELFTPLLKQIENDKIAPLKYTYGSRGPAAADELAKKHGFVFDSTYKWISK